MVSSPILVHPKWNVQFHVHVDAFAISLGSILAQPNEGNLDHPIYFSNWKLCQA